MAAASTPTTKKPVRAHSRLYLFDLYFVGGQPVTVPGRRVRIGGVVWPYARNQMLTISTYIGRRLIRWYRRPLHRSRSGTYGGFSVDVSSPVVGYMTVVVTHASTRRMRAFKVSRGFSALDGNIGFGSTGRFVQLMQQRLGALHFYIPQSGVYDQGMGLALDAYHRLLHWGTSQTLDGATATWLLDGRGSFPVRYRSHGRHAEGNLSVQLLALIDGSTVRAIYPISSGKPSTPTVLGSFHVYRKVPGYLPDGMYFSNFFYTGYAIHGYNPAPDYPASHGCMRVPIVDAISIYNWLGIGDGVDVYY